MKSKKQQVAIIGAQGYAGMELIKLLSQHPYAQLSAVFTRQKDFSITHELPLFKEKNPIPNYLIEELEAHSQGIDVFFLATPHDVSMNLVHYLMAKNKIVIDLSGAFRLDKKGFSHWYGLTHTAENYLENALYGLSPWQKNYHPKKLIANPGCFATCALMALLPLIKEEIIETTDIVIDAKSGVSGAGRSAKRELLFCEMMNNFYPYKIGAHQHIPEIIQCIDEFCHIKTNPLLMTHIMPVERGISMSIYLTPKNNSADDDINTAYEKAYSNYPFVQFGSVKNFQSEESKQLLSLKKVVGTPNVHIGFTVKNKKILVFACIDNLLKGAASQAVENFNCLFNLPVETGLIWSE